VRLFDQHLLAVHRRFALARLRQLLLLLPTTFSLTAASPMMAMVGAYLLIYS